MEAVPFTKGQEVEVSSTEEGVEGSWYTGTIIRPSKKKEDTYIVEYDKITHETESKQLREFIHVSNIRPRPPPEAIRLFEANEEVDAYVDDGWWQGLVIKILEGNRYVVYFSKTTEQMVLEQSDLRTYMEWNGETWFRPPQRGKVEPVEVSFDDENLGGAWFPATVLKEIGTDSFLVEYRALRCGENVAILKEIVDSQHVRPPPPSDSATKKFDLLQNVDAFYDFGWWNGVITRVLGKERYTVFLKHQNKEKELNQSELRLHMEWIDGKWLQVPGKTSVIQQSQSGVESSIPTGSTVVRTEMANQQIPNAVHDTLKRKFPSSPGNSYQVMTPSPTNKPAFKINPTSRSTEVSQPCKKLKEGVAKTNCIPMKACQLSGTSNGNSIDMEAQRNPVMPIHPKRKRSEKVQRKGWTKNCQNALLSSNKRGRLKIVGSNIKSSVEGQKHKKQGQGRPRKVPASSIKFSTPDPEKEERVVVLALPQRQKLANRGAKDHVFLPQLRQKPPSPLGVNSRVSPENLDMPYEGTTNLGECNNTGGDEQNRTTLSSFVTEATKNEDSVSLPQSPFSSLIDCTEVLNHHAEEHSMLLENSNFPPEAEDRGVPPEGRTTPSGLLTMEMQEHQHSSVVVEYSSNMDKLRTLAENNRTEGNEQNERALQCFILDPTSNRFSSSPAQGYEGGVPRSRPFLTSSQLSSLWESVYSFSAFSSVSQKPHFRRLEQYNKEIREGIALGYMACFANIVEKTRITTLDEPHSSFEEKLAALDELEELGFTVHPVQSRLQELLTIKGNYEQLEDVSKVVKMKIIDEQHKNGRLEEQIEGLQKAIIEINERLQSVLTEKEMKESQVADLESNIDKVRQSIQGFEHNFNRIVAAPW